MRERQATTTAAPDVIVGQWLDTRGLLARRRAAAVRCRQQRAELPIGLVLPEDHRGLESFAHGGTAQGVSLEIRELGSAWEPVMG